MSICALASALAAIGSFVAPAVIRLIGLRPAFVAVGAIHVLVLVSHRRLLEIDQTIS